MKKWLIVIGVLLAVLLVLRGVLWLFPSVEAYLHDITGWH